MHHLRDASSKRSSSKGRIIQGKHHPRNASSKGCHRSGTHRLGTRRHGIIVGCENFIFVKTETDTFVARRNYFLLRVSHIVYQLYEVFKTSKFSHAVATFAQILITTLAKMSLTLLLTTFIGSANISFGENFQICVLSLVAGDTPIFHSHPSGRIVRP